MNRIKIKNFGSIKEGAGDKWIELNQTTIFYGEPNTGKTTILKLIALFTWLEKQIELKRIKLSGISPTFSKQCFNYYGLTDNFFKNNTVIECEGMTHRFTVEQNKDFYTEIKAERISDDYKSPKILFVPQNRYLLSEANHTTMIKEIPGYLHDFLCAWDMFLSHFSGIDLRVPHYGLYLRYNKFKKVLSVKGKDFVIKIQDASQTIKQVAPLLLVFKQYLGVDTYDYGKQKRSLEEINVIKEEIIMLWNKNNMQAIPEILKFFTKNLNDYNYSIIDDVRAEDIAQIPLNENKTVLSMGLLEKNKYQDLEENTNHYRIYKDGSVHKM
jgi:hypothetical protein